MISEILYQQQVGILAFLCFLCFIALYNLFTLKRLGTSPPLSRAPAVSILVPARDEAFNIEGCLDSLLNQDYEAYEVIVLDDESQDATFEILVRMSDCNPRLKVLSGQTPPSGWMGKNWACHQLSQVAKGELILFVDADTRHHPGMLTEAVLALYATQADLLSGLPRQELKTWGERFILPVIPWAILSIFPVHLFQRLPFSFLSIAVGQFMLFRRSAYMQIGGHSIIRNSVIDDFALARLVKRNALKWEFIDLSGKVYCRMYHNFKEVLDGLSKNLYALFGNNLPVFLFIWLWLAIVFIQPILSLILYLLGILLPGYSPALAIAGVTLSLFLWLASGWFFRVPLALALAYPLVIALTGTIAIRSIWLNYSRHSISWKGRELIAPHRQADK